MARIPPLAGVIGKSANIVVYRVVFPVCGVIGAVRGIVTGSAGIPRVRGLSVNVLLIYECGDVFPRLRGYRSKSKIRLFENGIPRLRGYRHEPAL